MPTGSNFSPLELAILNASFSDFPLKLGAIKVFFSWTKSIMFVGSVLSIISWLLFEAIMLLSPYEFSFSNQIPSSSINNKTQRKYVKPKENISDFSGLKFISDVSLL